MANQPVDLPLCVHQKLSNDFREPRVHENSSEISIIFESFNPDWETNSTISFSERNLSSALNRSKPFSNSIDSLITHPGYQALTSGSLLGNVIMICVILCMPQFRRPANYLIVNLSLSSILFIISANLRLAENAYSLWNYSTVICQLLAVLHRIPIPCVALTTMMISLDRGRVARNPMNCSPLLSPLWKILSIWIFSVIIVLPLAFTRVYDECISAAYKCAKVLLFDQPTLSMAYGICYLLSVHVIPAVILINESVKTHKIMRFLKKTGIKSCSSIMPCSTPSMADNRLLLLRNSCLFTIIFLVFWLPYGIFQFPLDLPKEILPELLEIYVRFYFRFVRNFTYVQIALNPVILFALSYDLRMYLGRVQSDWRERMQVHTLNDRPTRQHFFRHNNNYMRRFSAQLPS